VPYEFIVSFGLFVCVSFMEELLTRGYILNNLLISFSPYKALFISSVIFSLMHAFNPNINILSFLNLFAAGILLGLPYLYTKRLWFSIGLHFGWNFFQGTIFGFAVSGKQCYSAIEITIANENKWNGGAFGFEASLLCLVLQVTVIALTYYFFHNRRNLQKSIL
jgi:hypothetical protein